VESSSDVICLIGLDGRIEMISPSVERVIGRSPDSLTGTAFGEVVHPDDLDAAYENFERAMREPTAMTVRALHADGSTRTLEATTTPVAGSDGRPERILAAVRDVSERQLLEEQLRHAQKMESIGRLAGGVAHDFNNILTAIRGYAELLLLDLTDDAAARENAEEIARAAARAAGLTGQLLAFSRKQVLRPQRLDLNDVVSGMSQLLGRVLGEDVVLTTALAHDLRATLADPTQIEQVVLNLAVNARDAMPGGGRLVIRTANVDLEEGPHVALVVADGGHGMDAETAARIFEPFFTTKEVGAGTGLGLATVHGIVAQSGGAVEVTSEPGVGTTFTVCLPACA
jgi:PAS domain S-box-containing protein